MTNARADLRHERGYRNMKSFWRNWYPWGLLFIDVTMSASGIAVLLSVPLTPQPTATWIAATVGCFLMSFVLSGGQMYARDDFGEIKDRLDDWRKLPKANRSPFMDIFRGTKASIGIWIIDLLFDIAGYTYATTRDLEKAKDLMPWPPPSIIWILGLVLFLLAAINAERTFSRRLEDSHGFVYRMLRKSPLAGRPNRRRRLQETNDQGSYQAGPWGNRPPGY